MSDLNEDLIEFLEGQKPDLDGMYRLGFEACEIDQLIEGLVAFREKEMDRAGQ